MNNKEKVLALIYTFFPYRDTSGNVFAKRLCSEIKKPTIVVTNKYLSKPPVDHSLSELVDPYLDKRIELQSTFTYRDWKFFKDYIDGALTTYTRLVADGENITRLYSRSMSAVTHLAAYMIKKNNPNIKWIAEFSDPIVKDVDGSERSTVIPEDWIKDSGLMLDLMPYDDNRNLFFISELLPYIFADEIIFTNNLQQNYMLSYLNDKILDIKLKGKLNIKIKNKSLIKSHPTLDVSFYDKGNFNEQIDRNYINIAYFGNVNFNRNFDEIFEAWSSLSFLKRKKIRLYIYTNMREQNIRKNIPPVLNDNVYISPALRYLDYLKSLNNFDYLLSLDTKVKDVFGVNPFLPSKISDYLGSNSKILAILERGSPTDLLDSPRIVKQYFGDVSLNEVVQEK